MKNKIIDQKKGWFMFHNDFIDGYAKVVGWKGQIVYMALSRHADTQGKCFPSIKHLSFELGVSESSIKRGINKLKEFNIIKTKMRTKMCQGRGSNIYYLLDKENWEEVYNWSNRRSKDILDLY